MFQQTMFSTTSSNSGKSNNTQNSNDIQRSQISRDSLNPSAREILENSLLHKQDKTDERLRVSYGQIECLSKGSYGNVSSENLQNVRAVAAVSNFIWIY